MTTTQIKPLTVGVTAAPTGVSAAVVAGGGTFAGAVPFFWKITATGPFGESLPSAEVTGTPAASGHAEITVTTWPAGTTGWKIYRGTVTATENVLVAAGGGGTGTTIAWDTGSAGSAATPPVAAALATSAKTLITIPTKSSVPGAVAPWNGSVAGFPMPFSGEIYRALAQWLCLATSATAVPAVTGTPPTPAFGVLARKHAAAAGYLLQET